MNLAPVVINTPLSFCDQISFIIVERRAGTDAKAKFRPQLQLGHMDFWKPCSCQVRRCPAGQKAKGLQSMPGAGPRIDDEVGIPRRP